MSSQSYMLMCCTALINAGIQMSASKVSLGQLHSNKHTLTYEADTHTQIINQAHTILNTHTQI